MLYVSVACVVKYVRVLCVCYVCVMCVVREVQCMITIAYKCIHKSDKL